ncbi:LacI family transcriptional regulator [Saccharobesus litoralis]|uniref:LacI family transcriptional regulator n=1 Tax=Saccharobesus litoralis TaxID=2172099 RepID=A0A2S0VNC3_9ALTE|nr:LacI family DNA-binding transcriptional regulator [Saccharobesus litoralis]AWB65713.1 LacI family transcriptional regulator [Saccharobesus litoralis]
MKVTLDDVALEAGVSRATVDRVLNERGNVSPITIERVNRALYSTNYLLEPVAEHKTAFYTFDFIFPTPHSRYLDFYSRQVDAIKDCYHASHINARIHRVEAFKPQALATKLLEIGDNTDGIAFVALEHPAVKKAVDLLVAQGVGVISLVSDITNTQRLAYVGIDNRAAGRTAGLMMGRLLDKGETGKIGLFIGSHAYRGHEEREAGFRGVIRERFPHLRLLEMPELLDNDARAQEVAMATLKEENLLGIYNVGGGTEGIAQALKKLDRANDTVFIAHELFDHTREYLIDGTIDAIINQNIKHEAYNAVEMLINYKSGQSIQSGLLEPRVEIYLAENV